MAETVLALGSAGKLIDDSNETLNELDATVKTVKMIYETFDVLKKSWTGEKSNQYKEVLEDIREPLLSICETAQRQTQALNNVGKIVADYHRK